MQFISCSTLHKEYIPTAYSHYVLPLWCGFGKQSDYYYCASLEYDIPHFTTYVRDVRRYVYQQERVDNILVEEELPSYTGIQQAIENLGQETIQESKENTLYRSLAFSYILEEYHHDIKQETACIAGLCESLESILPLSSHNTVAIDDDRELYNTMVRTIVRLCSQEEDILFVVHNDDIERYVSQQGVYSQLPDNLYMLLEEYEILSCYKGYLSDASMIYSDVHLKGIPLLFL